MKESSPAASADDQPEIEPDHGKRDGVEDREQQAAHRLAAQPGGQDAVDLARLRPQHAGVAARQPAIDPRHRAPPVAQQVEGDHAA